MTTTTIKTITTTTGWDYNTIPNYEMDNAPVFSKTIECNGDDYTIGIIYNDETRVWDCYLFDGDVNKTNGITNTVLDLNLRYTKPLKTIAADRFPFTNINNVSNEIIEMI